MKKTKKKPKQPRNYLAIHAHNRNSAGVMGVKKGRKNKEKYDRLHEDLEEALDILKEMEKEDD